MQYTCSSTSSSCAMAVPKLISMKTLLLLFVLAAGDQHLILKPKEKRVVCCLQGVLTTGTGTLRFWNLSNLGYTYASKRNHPRFFLSFNMSIDPSSKDKENTHTHIEIDSKLQTYIHRSGKYVTLCHSEVKGFITHLYSCFRGCLVIFRMARVSECWFPGDKRMGVGAKKGLHGTKTTELLNDLSLSCGSIKGR